ncbi:MAG: 3-carboxy-cis,cis-muconate cycloisomerase [Geminicoccaceae bacterium]
MICAFDHLWLGRLFGDNEALAIWQPEVQLQHYLAFEAALARALEASGRVAAGQGERAAAAITGFTPDVARLAEATASDGLPVPDLVRQLRVAAQPDEAAVHTGATSQDVLDTALALSLRALTDLLLPRLDGLAASLLALRARFGEAPLTGRTRMQAALPIKVQDRLDSWRAPLLEHASRLISLRPEVERLQLGGAVGTRAAFGDDADAIAKVMAQELGLSAGAVWHTDRSALAAYAGQLSLITGTLGKIGQDVCLMAQQGVDDIAIAGGGGSSAMPHKSNPVLAELLVTLARYNATQLAGVHQALVHEQERSGAAWMLEWLCLPQMSVATCRSLGAAHTLCQQIVRIGAPGR